MPYCPSCKYEYRDGIARCPDCDVDMVESLEESLKQAHEIDPVLADEPRVAVFDSENRMESVIVKGMLEDAGFAVQLGASSSDRMPVFSMNPYTDNRVFVLGCHAEEARSIIESFHSKQ